MLGHVSAWLATSQICCSLAGQRWRGGVASCEALRALPPQQQLIFHVWGLVMLKPMLDVLANTAQVTTFITTSITICGISARCAGLWFVGHSCIAILPMCSSGLRTRHPQPRARHDSGPLPSDQWGCVVRHLRTCPKSQFD
jgi:hypothetical protein